MCLQRSWNQQLPFDPAAGWRGVQPGWPGMMVAYGLPTCPPTSAPPEICRPRPRFHCPREAVSAVFWSWFHLYTRVVCNCKCIVIDRTRLSDWRARAQPAGVRAFFIHQRVRHMVTAGRVCLRRHLPLARFLVINSVWLHHLLAQTAVESGAAWRKHKTPLRLPCAAEGPSRRIPAERLDEHADAG